MSYLLFAGEKPEEAAVHERFVLRTGTLNDHIRYIQKHPEYKWALCTDERWETILLSWFAPANQWIATDAPGQTPGGIHYIGLNGHPQAKWSPESIPLHLHVWTDGSCPKQHNSGGWAARIEYRTRLKGISGKSFTVYTGIQVLGWYADITTSQYMELMAVLGALRAVKHEGRKFQGVTVFLDNEWVQRCALKIYTPTKYPAEFAELDMLTKAFAVGYNKVKGHSGVFENEQVDRLANYFQRQRHQATGTGTEDIIAPQALPREQFYDF